MSDAQIITLKQQIETGQMETDAAYILDFIKKRTRNGVGTTLLELQANFTMAVSTIVARLSGLEDLGLIYINGKKTYEKPVVTKKRTFSLYYFEPNEFVQSKNRDDVKKRKISKAAKSLLNRFKDDLNETLKEELIKII